MSTWPVRLAAILGAMTVCVTPVHAIAEVLHTEPMRRQGIPPSGAGPQVAEIGRGEKTSINFWQMDASAGMPPHLHKEHEEVILVQGGRAETRIGQETVEVGPGDVLVVRPGTVHGARVLGTEPFFGISVFTPPFDGKDRWPAPAKEEP
jgi:quercetin dioxygenase-like cupin family protein